MNRSKNLRKSVQNANGPVIFFFRSIFFFKSRNNTGCFEQIWKCTFGDREVDYSMPVNDEKIIGETNLITFGGNVS